MFNTPKVLVAGPISSVKDYCFDEWVDNVKNFTYTNYDVLLVDNSVENSFSEKIKQQGIKFFHITTEKNKKSLLKRLAISHELVRRYTLSNDYDYLLHLETDVIPPKDIIEKLLFKIHSDNNKLCLAAMYQYLTNSKRKPLLQTILTEENLIRSVVPQNLNTNLIDGEVKKVYSAGLGCVLMKKELLKKIKFRHIENTGYFTDVLFVGEMYNKKIPYYVDTSILCTHRNKDWGEFNIHYN